VKQNKPSENTFLNRCAQFERDERKNATSPDPKKTTATPKVAEKDQNPYLRARLEVLKKYPAWRREEIGEMERTGNINNRYYSDFVHEVTLLGDTYMPFTL